MDHLRVGGHGSSCWRPWIVLLVLMLTGCGTGMKGRAPIISERLWRPAAAAHRQRVLGLLREGFLDEDNKSTGKTCGRSLPPSSTKRAAKIAVRQQQQDKAGASRMEKPVDDGFQRLNPDHAVFNFLHDYYNIRGAKGSRRLGRWSSGLSFVTLEGATAADLESGVLCPVGCKITPVGVTYDMEQHFKEAQPSAATAYMWYEKLLASTAQADPVLNCYCLHEWAMQYWPKGADRPPSQKYQRDTMPLRVTQVRRLVNLIILGVHAPNNLARL